MIIIYSELSIKKRVKSTTFFFLNLIVNEDKKQVIDDKVQSEVQLNKEQNMNKSNNKADVDEDFQIDITTTKDVSCMNQNNYISADSLKRFQEWKPPSQSSTPEKVLHSVCQVIKCLCILVFKFLKQIRKKVILLSPNTLASA